MSNLIKTKNFNKQTWENDYNYILNYLKDNIEKEETRKLFIEVEFTDNEIVHLSIFDYLINIIMWYPLIQLQQPIEKKYIFFPENITKREIKRYIDNHIIINFREKISNTELNVLCSDLLDYFKFIKCFGFYLSNTISMIDNVKLMRKEPLAYEAFHLKLSNEPFESVKRIGQEYTNKLINITKNNPWHGLSSVFKTGEVINKKQYREFAVNIGVKPDGKGGIIPIIIDNSYINGGLKNIAYNFSDSTGGRIIDIIKSKNVGDAGDFARRLGLNNSDLILHEDPDYVCDSVNFLPVFIENEEVLSLFKMRYYRLSPNGIEYYIDIDYKKHLDLIGKKIYLRSPMTCASASRDNKVCHRCYGKLAITNSLINIGSYAVKALSSGLTQGLIGAKHILEAAVKKLEWMEDSLSLISFDGNIIKLTNNMNFSGYKFIIEPESISLEDNKVFNESIDKFYLLTPFGERKVIMTSNLDKMYISNQLNNIIRNDGYQLDDIICIDCEKLIGKELLLIRIENNDLSKTLEDLKHIIDLNEVTSSHTIESIIRDFLVVSRKGGINIDNIHIEMILANQLRKVDDNLLKPEWEYKDEKYKFLTLSSSLNNNPNVLVSLSSGNVKSQLYNPSTFRKNKASFIDTFFMEQPQKFLKNEIKDIDNDIDDYEI